VQTNYPKIQLFEHGRTLEEDKIVLNVLRVKLAKWNIELELERFVLKKSLRGRSAQSFYPTGRHLAMWIFWDQMSKWKSLSFKTKTTKRFRPFVVVITAGVDPFLDTF
jgi:hypothetical protein